MNVEMRASKTPAEQALADAYAAARGRLPGNAAVKSLREGADLASARLWGKKVA